MSEQAQPQEQVEEITQEQPQESDEDLAAAFGIATEEPGEVEADSPEQPETEKTAPAPEEPTDPLALVLNDALFDEKALNNKPGIGKARHALLAARKAVRDAAQNNHQTHLQLTDREKRIKTGEGDLKKQKQAFDAHEKRFLADIDIALNGKPNEVLEALGRISKRSGVELYEGITTAMLEAKKKPQLDPEVKAKLAELEQIKADLEKVKERDEAQEGQQKVQRARQQWIQTANSIYQSNPAEYPNIQHFVEAEQRGEDVLSDLDTLNQQLWEAAGRPPRGIPLQVVMGELDRRYAKLERAQKQPPEQPKLKAGRLPGSGVSPARAATNGQTRELTEEERHRELAEDVDYLRGYGFQV